jgi:hypothetical protein
MCAVPETDVRLAIPEDVELLWAIPPGGVVIGAAQVHRHRRTRGDLNAEEPDVAAEPGLLSSVDLSLTIPRNAFVTG